MLGTNHNKFTKKSAYKPLVQLHTREGRDMTPGLSSGGMQEHLKTSSQYKVCEGDSVVGKFWRNGFDQFFFVPLPHRANHFLVSIVTSHSLCQGQEGSCAHPF